MIRTLSVIGTWSGGTSATAGALAVNGWGCLAGAPHFEEGRWVRFMQGARSPIPLAHAQAVLAASHADIRRLGYDRYVIKVPGFSVWQSHLWGPLGIEPLLVWRDPVDVLASLERRRLDMISRKQDVFDMQAEILRLHEAHGWPLLRFPYEQTALEEIVGHALPLRWIEPERVGTGATRQDVTWMTG